MSDGGSTRRKRGNGRSIFLGIVGALLGFVGMMGLAELLAMGHRGPADIGTALVVLLVFGPMGAVGGAFLGAWLGNRGREQVLTDEAIRDVRASGAQPTAASAAPAGEVTDPGKTVRRAGNALLILVVLGGAFAIYKLNQKPVENFSLNPGGPNPVLQFEVRLPAGSAMPAADTIRASLHERPHGMTWARMKPDLFRRDGERVVLVGEADLAFRTADRQIQMEIKPGFDEVFYLVLPATAPHEAEFGVWHPRSAGEIRYRAKWPGKN